jgi:hypothetical protein
MGIVLHHMPYDRPIAEGNERLGYALPEIPESGAEASAEDDDLHRTPSPERRRRIGAPAPLGIVPITFGKILPITLAPLAGVRGTSLILLVNIA